MNAVPSRPRAIVRFATRLALTVVGAGALGVAMWLGQQPMLLDQEIAAALERSGVTAGQHTRHQGSTASGSMRTALSAFPSILIVREDRDDAARRAGRFRAALLDADLYPHFETALLDEGGGTACAGARDGILPRSLPTMPAAWRHARLIYAIGDCAMQRVIAAARSDRLQAALQVGEDDSLPPGPMLLVFSDIDEAQARLRIPLAQAAGYTVTGVLVAPPIAVQLRWARRYFPDAVPLRIGRWHGDKEDAVSFDDTPTSERGAMAREEGDDTIDGERPSAMPGGIEFVSGGGRIDATMVRWREADVRLLYVDAQTPASVIGAALATGIGTLCAADVPMRSGTCLMHVTTLQRAASALAASLATRLLASVDGEKKGALSAPWRAPPQGPLRVDIDLVRRTGLAPPLSLWDEVSLVTPAPRYDDPPPVSTTTATATAGRR